MKLNMVDSVKYESQGADLGDCCIQAVFTASV